MKSTSGIMGAMRSCPEDRPRLGTMIPGYAKAADTHAAFVDVILVAHASERQGCGDGVEGGGRDRDADHAVRPAYAARGRGP